MELGTPGFSFDTGLRCTPHQVQQTGKIVSKTKGSLVQSPHLTAIYKASKSHKIEGTPCCQGMVMQHAK